MAAAADVTERDLEQGAVMDTFSGDGEHISSTNNGRGKRMYVWVRQKKDRVMLWLEELLTEQVDPETQSEENERIRKMAFPILSCSVTVITTVTTNNELFGQAVLILSALSLVLSFIAIVASVATPAPSLVKMKRIVLVSAGFFFICSFLAYVAMKMGPVQGIVAAAIFFSGGFVFSVTILFLIPTIFWPPTHTTHTAGSAQSRSTEALLSSAPFKV